MTLRVGGAGVRPGYIRLCHALGNRRVFRSMVRVSVPCRGLNPVHRIRGALGGAAEPAAFVSAGVCGGFARTADAHLSAVVEPPDDILFCKLVSLCTVVCEFAERGRAPATLDLFLSMFRVSHRSQMGRVTACRVVALVMQDAVRRDRPDEELVHHLVNLPPGASQKNASVAAVIQRARPEPTAVWSLGSLSNARPESAHFGRGEREDRTVVTTVAHGKAPITSPKSEVRSLKRQSEVLSPKSEETNETDHPQMAQMDADERQS